MVTFEQIVAFAIVLGALLAAIVLVNNARKAIDEMRKPFSDMQRMVAEHEESLKKGNERMDKQDKCINLMLRSNKLMMQHMAYGNHVEQLKEMCDEFDEFLIEGRG